MARLDNTAVWFQRGEDESAMADTPSPEGSDSRSLPPIAWIGAAVALAATLLVGTLRLVHASAAVGEPVANPAAAPATAPAAAPSTQPALPSEPGASSVLDSSAPRAPASASSASGVLTSTAAPPSAVPTPVPPKAQASVIARTSAALLAGERLLRHGRPAAALARFEQSLAHDPADARALRGACASLGRLRRAGDAARVCRRARSAEARRG